MSPVLDFNIKGGVCSQRRSVEKAHTRRLFPGSHSPVRMGFDVDHDLGNVH